MTKYMRPEGQELRTVSYVYEATHRTGQNFTIHDVAKATSEAPSSPNPLFHRGVLYLDGGICCNNPAEIAMAEAQIMWPLDENTVPHLLMSIGNGWAQDAVNSEDVSNKYSSWMEMKKDQLVKFFRTRPTKLQKPLDRNRLSEKPWNEAFSHISKRHPIRCVRLNPKISGNQTPEDIAAKYVSQEHSRLDISKLCHALLATTFYFDATERHHQIGNGRSVIKGEILCRFPQGADITKSLGRVFERLCNPRIELITPGRGHKRWDFNADIISCMKKDGLFNLPIDFEVPSSR